MIKVALNVVKASPELLSFLSDLQTKRILDLYSHDNDTITIVCDAKEIDTPANMELLQSVLAVTNKGEYNVTSLVKLVSMFKQFINKRG